MVATSVGVTAEPEIQIFSSLKPVDKAIVIASDGLWDRLTNEEIMLIVLSDTYYPKKDSEGAATHLVNESARRWQNEQGMVDDITIIVAYLQIEPKPVTLNNEGAKQSSLQQVESVSEQIERGGGHISQSAHQNSDKNTE